MITPVEHPNPNSGHRRTGCRIAGSARAVTLLTWRPAPGCLWCPSTSHGLHFGRRGLPLRQKFEHSTRSDGPNGCLDGLTAKMLSIGKLAGGPAAGRYYIEQVAKGLEDYYAGEGEAAGVRMGSGAASLGLSGEVDEHGLQRLLEAAEQAQARLVLVGDDRQLPEIQAGGLFSVLADRLGAIELTQVRRQREAWDRDALAALRDGDVDRFADAYHERGRIVAAPTAEAARERLVADWLASYERGEHAVMLAHRRRDVADLNERARRALRELGQIGDDQISAHGRAFAVGDRVVARRNDRRLGIVNGDTARIAVIGDHAVTLTLTDDRTVRVPESYVRAGHLEHGYALTAHLARGATVDRAFVLGSDELYREWGYTALSRHREEARFYVSATPAFLNESRTPLEKGVGAARSVSRVLRASRAQRLAVDGIRTDPLRDLLVDSLKRAEGELAAIDDRVAGLGTALDDLRWFERTARRDLERRIEVGHRQREHWRAETQRMAREIDARPARVPSPCSRAIDPLAGLEPGARELDRQHDRGIER